MQAGFVQLLPVVRLALLVRLALEYPQRILEPGYASMLTVALLVQCSTPVWHGEC